MCGAKLELNIAKFAAAPCDAADFMLSYCKVRQGQEEVCSMIVQRNEYVEELKSGMHNGLVKVLTGIRRCGKSYLLSVLFKNYLLDRGVPIDHIIEVPLSRR